MCQISSSEKQMKIMIVEDNRINQVVIKGVLSSMNLSADIVNNGQEALDLLNSCVENDLYQLIIMDCQMPILDGYQTTQMIRRGEAGDINKNIIIIAITASDSDHDREKCLSVGMNDYTTKPVNADILQAKLCYWLGLTQEESHLPEQHIASRPQDIDISDGKASDKDIWDKVQFYARVRHNEQLAKRLQSLFLEEAPPIIKRIQQAIKENDMTSVTVNVHKLKSISFNLSANKLGKLARKVEAAVLNNLTYTQMTKLTQHLDDVYQELYTKIKNS